MPQLTRITRDPAVMGGKPCIRAMRVTMGTARSRDMCTNRLTISCREVEERVLVALRDKLMR